MTWKELIKYAKKNKAIIKKDYFTLFGVLFHKSGIIKINQQPIYMDYDNMYDILQILSKNQNKSVVYYIWMIIKKIVKISFKLFIMIIGFMVIKSIRGRK